VSVGYRAGKRLGEMVVKQRVSNGLPFMRGFFQQQEQKSKSAGRDSEPPAPPAQRPFPWEKRIASAEPFGENKIGALLKE
jgi:hypothetical protein